MRTVFDPHDAIQNRFYFFQINFNIILSATSGFPK